MPFLRRNFTERPSAYMLPVWATVALPRVRVTCAEAGRSCLYRVLL